MKVAFVTTHDSTDVHAWSGITYHMLTALRAAGLEIEVIDKLRDPYSLFFKAKRILINGLLGKNYLRDREPLTIKSYARQVETRLKHLKPDLIFSDGTIPIAYLQTDTPIVFWTDATFDGIIDFYPEFTNLCGETLRNGHAIEQSALSNCRLAIYASEWAAKTALTKYRVEDKKVTVVPFGANFQRFPTADETEKLISSRTFDVCKLLFVGVDWKRKGGDAALAVASTLNQRGLNTELHVVGCEPPSPVPIFVKRHGFLSKKNYQETELLTHLFKTSTFFILPSEAECLGIVVAEACAHGLPPLTTTVGGFTTAIKDGINGRTFDPLSFRQECADFIFETLSSKDRYRQLCLSSMKEYTDRLNWNSATQSVVKLIASEALPRPSF